LQFWEKVARNIKDQSVKDTIVVEKSTLPKTPSSVQKWQGGLANLPSFTVLPWLISSLIF